MKDLNSNLKNAMNSITPDNFNEVADAPVEKAKGGEWFLITKRRNVY